MIRHRFLIVFLMLARAPLHAASNATPLPPLMHGGDEPITVLATAGVIDATTGPHNDTGDETSDDRDAFQKALDDYPSDNRTIDLP
jgi:hypothetical protein